MGFKDFVSAEQHGQVAATPEASSAGDDLFEFDDRASSGEELDHELSDALSEAPSSPQPAPALPKAGQSQAARSTLTHPAPSLLASALPPPDLLPPVKGAAIPHAMVAVLMLLLVANVLTLVAGWKSQTEVGGLLQRINGRPADDVELIRQQAIEEARRSNVASIARPEGYQTLDVAKRAVDQADFGRARQELFALQAVADRLDSSVRDDVLARAAFMIADAYRLQAESVAVASTQEQRP